MIARTHGRVRIDRELAGQGLTWGQLHALVTLERHGGWTHAASLGRRLGITRQAAHALMSRLDDRGFLQWKADGRIRSARLTHDGRDAANLAWEAIDEIVASIERTTAEERCGLVSAQRSLDRELRRPRQRTPFSLEYLSEEIRRESVRQ